jgi:hypothetical protein
MKTALIGHTGLIGSVLKRTSTFDKLYNSANIAKLPNDNVDTIICSAPSANRLVANQNPEADLESVNMLIDSIRHSGAGQVILIGTIDAVNYTNMPYGRHRKLLEDFVRTEIEDHYIIRLCSLIDKTIVKNPLYDLKHKKFIEKIQRNAQLQWYSLNNLHKDITLCIEHKVREITLASEPVNTLEIITEFFPEFLDIIKDSETPQIYDIKTEHHSIFGQTIPYAYNKLQVFKCIEEYLT